MTQFSLANLFGITIRESATDGSDFTNPDADYRRLFLGEDGQLHVKDSAGAVTDIGGAVSEITDLPTADTTTTNVLAPDGAGGVEWRAEAGGGISFATLGTTSIGGSFDNPTQKSYFKKITVASKCLIASISVGLKGNANNPFGVAVGIHTDSSGAANVIGANSMTNEAASDLLLTNLLLSATARIVTFPLGIVVDPADYWIGVMLRAASAGYGLIAYAAGTGSDTTMTARNFGDGSVFTPSATTNDYTIYANILT